MLAAIVRKMSLKKIRAPQRQQASSLRNRS
jgi:hypothetical protein